MENKKNTMEEKKEHEIKENVRGTYNDEATRKDMGVTKKDHDKVDKNRMHT